MESIEFSVFANGLTSSPFALKDNSRLTIAKDPSPFVSPRLDISSSNELRCDVILIRASAAVGKSTVARRLSAKNNIPILDLTKVTIGAGGISGFLDALEGDAREAFLKGELPIIIDALDEALLTYSAKAFDEFFEDTARFIAPSEDQIGNRKPKLICFGRYQAVETVRFIFEVTNNELEISVIDIGFFEKSAAFELLISYANQNAHDGSAWRNQPREQNEVVTAFFTSIATALGIRNDALWSSNDGQAFVGYAPVLRAVGILLSSLGPTFDSFRTRLADQGSTDAWQVIENVLALIFDREQIEKVVDPLTKAFRSERILAQGQTLPNALFARRDQIWLILQLIDGIAPEDLTSSIQDDEVEGVFEVPWDIARERYLAIVKTFIKEHPFYVAAQKSFSNEVVASICIADAIINGWAIGSALNSQIASLSRSPFLWRSLKSHLPTLTPVSGSTASYVFNSYWNDPIITAGVYVMEIVETPGANQLKVTLPLNKIDVASFEVNEPLTFYSQISNCRVSVPHTQVCLTGYRGSLNARADESAGAFFFRGNVLIECKKLTITASEISINGSEIWVDTAQFVREGPIDIKVRPGADYGWGTVLAAQYPWNRHASTITKPSTESNELSRLFARCAEKLKSVPSVVVFDDLSIPANDHSMSWARSLGSTWPLIVKSMIEENVAESRIIGAKGSTAKKQISFSVDWLRLVALAQQGTGEISTENIRGVVKASRL